MIFNITIYYISNVKFNKFLYHIFKNNILNILLISILAIFIGIIISFIGKRIKAYTVILLIILLVSPVVEYISFPLIEGLNIDIYNFTDFIQILIPDTNYVAEWLYGLSIDTKRWLIVFMWILVCIVILIDKVIDKKSFIYKSSLATLGISIVIIFILIVNAGERLCLDYRTMSFSIYDQRYYQLNKIENIVNSNDIEFTIDKYNMNLFIDKKLNAEVEIYLTNNSYIKEYNFTLYRAYEIESIIDNEGKELEFSRNGDYFSIINKSNKNIDYIKIKYSGFAPTYYSNEKAIYLPAYFPYYPMEGYQQIYTSSGSYESERLLGKKQFNVNVESKLDVYSNLNKNENIYSGVGEGVTLIAGLIEEIAADGVDVIKSPLSKNLDNINCEYINELQNAFNEVSWIFGEQGVPQVIDKKIIQIPQLNSATTKFIETSYSDHIFMYFIDDPKEVIKYYLLDSISYRKEKQRTREVFLGYVDDMLYGNKENEFLCEDKEFEQLIKDKEKLYDKKEFISIIYKYLQNENSLQNENEFFNSL